MFKTLLRQPTPLFAVILFASLGASAAQIGLSALSSKDASGGLRAALSQGVDVAVSQLGANNGFLNNPKVTIPLPSALEKAGRALRMLGWAIKPTNLKRP